MCVCVHILICNIYSDSVTQCNVIIVWKANIDFTDVKVYTYFCPEAYLIAFKHYNRQYVVE